MPVLLSGFGISKSCLRVSVSPWLASVTVIPFDLSGKYLSVKSLLTLFVLVFVPAVVMRQGTSPQQVADELLAADRAFSAASAKTDLDQRHSPRCSPPTS